MFLLRADRRKSQPSGIDFPSGLVAFTDLSNARQPTGVHEPLKFQRMFSRKAARLRGNALCILPAKLLLPLIRRFLAERRILRNSSPLLEINTLSTPHPPFRRIGNLRRSGAKPNLLFPARFHNRGDFVIY